MKSRQIGSGFTAFFATVSLLALSSTGHAASSEATVSPEQFKAWTDWAKKSVEILNQRQKKLESQEANRSNQTTGGSSDGSVDLSNLSTPTGSSETSLKPDEGGSGHAPKLETFFDFNLVNQPGTYDALAFDNYHSFVFFYLTPTPDITFSFNLLGPSVFPVYYELDYQASKALTLRAGKIWVPFDDLSAQSPHNIFGGRVGLQQLMPTATGNGGNTFLPSIWTELGVGAKLMLVDSEKLQLQTDLCVLNGYSNTGTDPVNGGEYPNFNGANGYTLAPIQQGQGSSGNHRNKSVAARAHALFENTFGIGVSYYGGQWNPDGDPAAGGGHLFLNMVGADAQLRLWGLEFRGGIASMNVELPEATAKRGGTYAEVGLPFAKNRWKILARGGTLNLDDRIAAATDETIVGGTILYSPGSVQFSLEHSRDIRDPGVSVGFTSYTDLRMIMLF